MPVKFQKISFKYFSSHLGINTLDIGRFCDTRPGVLLSTTYATVQVTFHTDGAADSNKGFKATYSIGMIKLI